jgi:Zn-finger nucleic acid-binding protein
MKCIHCNDEMEIKHIFGVEVDLCTNCGGLWLDGGELNDIAKYDLTAGRVISCFRCEKPMQTKLIKGIELDICPDCSSIWLDGGELKHLADLDFKAGRVITCSKCDDQLQTKMIKGVEVDVCPGCTGVFLDKGEMEKLSAIEPGSGGKTDIGQFIHDANEFRIQAAIRAFKVGKHDKGKAAAIAGVKMDMFDELIAAYETTEQASE